MPIKFTLTGDVSDLRRTTQQAREELRRVGTESQGVARQLRAVGSSFDGSRLEGQARRVVSGIERIGGVARLTDNEIARHSRTLTEALQKYERMGREAPAAIRRVADELRQAQGAARQLETASAGIGPALGRGAGALASGLGIGVGAGLGLGAITAIGGAMREIAAEGARIGPIAQSFERLQGGAARASDTLDDMQLRTRGLVGAVDLLRLSNQASQLQLTQMGVDMGELSGIAVTLGRAVGNNATQSIEDFIGALGRGSTEVLDNLGVTLKMGEAYDLYAARLGKTAAALTDQEKKQAFVTIGMERAREAAARLGEQQLTAAEQWDRITTLLSDGATEFGRAANESGLLTDILAGLADTLEDTGEAWRLAAEEEAKLAGNQRETVASSQEYITALEAILRLRRSIAETLRENYFEADLRRNPNLLGEALDATGVPVSGGPFNRLDLSQRGFQARSFIDLMREGADRAKEFEDQQRKAAEATARQEEQAAARRIAAAERLRQELEKLSGRDLVANAAALATNLDKVGTANILPRSLPTLVEQLGDALTRAQELGPTFAQQAGQIERKLRELVNTPAYREFFQRSLVNPTIGVNRNLEDPVFQRTGIAGALAPTLNPFPASTIGAAFDTFEAQRVRNSIAGINVDLGKGLKTLRDWRTDVRGLAQAFAQLAQIAGPAFGNLQRGVGTVFAAADTSGQLVDALAKALPSLGLTRTDEFGRTVITGRGQALSGALGGLTTGMTLGSMTSNPWIGGALGAGGGLATGAMLGLSAGMIGATAGIGAASAIYMAWRNRQAEKKALSEQRAQIIAAAGGYEEFRKAVESAGFEFEYFLGQFNSNDADTFTEAMNRLNVAMAEQRTRTTELVKGLQSVARVNGVLSAQQIAQIRTADPNGEGAQAIVQFAAQQRQLAESGYLQAASALERMASLTEAEIDAITAGLSTEAERQQAIERELARRAQDVLSRFGDAASGTAAGLYVAFSEAIAQGEDALSVLARFQPAIQTLQQLYARAGVTPGAGFQQLQVQSRLASDPQTGPLLQLAQGLGQALVGSLNSGMLSPELFGELARGIGQAYKQMELLGQGGLEAARLMQPWLQGIWQAIRDNPALRNELDETTLALLDFAEESGLIGEDFVPAVDQMIDALNRLIQKFDEWLSAMQGMPSLPTPPPASGNPPVGPGDYGQPAPPSFPPPNGGDYRVGLATGGIVTRPTRALIGEAGPEAVIPLSRSGVLSPVITIVTPVNLDGYEVARLTARHLPNVYRGYGAA